MLPILCITGHSGSGKTTLIEQLIPRLRRRGLRVGTLKHDVHGAEPDREGKDTWRHAQAGSQLVMLSGPRCLVTRRDVGQEPALESLAAYFEGQVDLVIAEGYSQSSLPRVEVFGDGSSAAGPRSPDRSRLVATVRAPEPLEGVPNFDVTNLDGLTELILRWQEERREVSSPEAPETGGATHEKGAMSLPPATAAVAPLDRVRVLVDGRELPLKPFLAKMLSGIVLGFLASLKWIGQPSSIRVELERAPSRIEETEP